MLVAEATVLLVVAVAYVLHTPAVPHEWLKVRRGMARTEVLRLLPDKVNDMRDLKGFDVFTREYRVLPRPSYWLLEVSYDEDDKVCEAWLHFVDRYCGALSKNREHVKRTAD